MSTLHRRAPRLLSFAAAAFAIAALSGCYRGPRVVIAAPDGTAAVDIRVEVADTADKRELGLMYRKHLDPAAGMLFVFEEPGEQSFWMKNTEFPLDMIFIGRDRRVAGIINDAQPFSLDPLTVPGAISAYVLEVNGGLCKRKGVRVGDRVRFLGLPTKSAR